MTPFLQKNSTALHYVAQRGFDREVDLLLEAGVNVNVVDHVSKRDSHMVDYMYLW